MKLYCAHPPGPRARYVFLMSPFPEGESASFNATYFEEIQRVIDVAAPGGMRVLLDVHQDLYSSAVCGEGASDAINATRVLPFPQPIGAAFGPGDYDSKSVLTLAACDRHPWQDCQLAHKAAVGHISGCTRALRYALHSAIYCKK